MTLFVYVTLRSVTSDVIFVSFRELYGATEAESSDKDLVRRIEDDSDSDGDSKPLAAKRSKMTPSKPTDFLTDEKLVIIVVLLMMI